MRKIWIVLLLALLLVACGDNGDNGDDDETPEEEPVENVDGVAQEDDDDEATQEPIDFAGQSMEPGIRTSGEVEVVAFNSYVSDDNTSGWLVMELRNTLEDSFLQNFLVTVSLLDSENRERDTLAFSTAFLNIPPGGVVPVVREFVPPDDYADFLALVEVEYVNVVTGLQDFQPVYDLTASVNDFDASQTPLTLTGTVTNDSGVVLRQPVAVVTLYDASGNLIAASGATLSGAEDGWETDTTINFEAFFSDLPTSDIAEARVTSVGYDLSSPE